jgi:hypothetical protein
VLALALVAMFATASTASAISVQKEYTKFAQCPIANPAVKQCVYAQTTSGEFVIGSRAVPITKTITIQGGVTESGELVPALDGNTLSKTPLTLPGGLLGIPGLEIGGEVTATAELVGTAHLSASNVIGGSGVGAALPLRVKLSNPALGEQCYIGSAAEPVFLQLTTGTTNPPSPNKPISGKTGTISLEPNVIIHIDENSLVDNSFSAPGVNGCGGLLSILLDPAIDLDAGLPAAAGHNTAILNGTLDASTPRSVKGETSLPQLGRCVKLKGVREGGGLIFHGFYNASNCVEEDPSGKGEYEWLVGTGANNKFTSTGGTVTLATPGASSIKCTSSAFTGEYTSPKTTSAVVTFNGCSLLAGKQPCQSSGAGAGQIVTSQLEGQLGFIRDTWTSTEGLTAVVGMDLKHEPTLITAECGGTKVAVSGSVVGTLTAIDKMALKAPIKFAAVAGKQSPEGFEGQPTDTLSTAFDNGTATTGGAATLTSTGSITSEERLEVKGVYEE